MTTKQLSSVECIAIEKRGFIPNRYYVYILIVQWKNGEKYPIYRKYSSFYDFEKMLKDRIGNKHNIPELPTMNVLQKAFKIEKNHVTDINEFCMGIVRLPVEIVNSHTVSAFFEIWPSDFPMDTDDKAGRKKEWKRKKVSESSPDEGGDHDKMSSLERALPSAPYEDVLEDYACLDEALSGLPTVPGSKSILQSYPSTSVEEDTTIEIYTCTADYVPDTRDELSLKEGMKCIVLERNDDGWWFIMRESDGHQGYAPGSFLAPALPKKLQVVDNHYSDEPVSSTITSSDNQKRFTGMRVKVSSGYQAKNGDEISCHVGEELEVVHTDHNGWWTVRCHGKTGLVPAVNLELTAQSVRSSEIFMRNNSLYTKKPPPRRGQRKAVDSNNSISTSSTTSSNCSVNENISEWVKKESPPSVISESGYATVDQLQEDMASRRIIPANQEKIPPKTTINYAEIVFDDDSDQPKMVKPQTVPVACKKQDTIIYTQIIPKNLRPKPEEKEPQVEDSLHSGKKPERGKAVKKPAAPPKAEELSSIQQGRNSPSPPPPHSTNNDSSSESPLPIKPRIRPSEPQHNYENHSVNPSTQTSSSTAMTNHYMNLNNGSNSQQITNNNTDQDFLRRSSIEPPPPPTQDAPRPNDSINSDGPSSIESYSPMITRVQAIASYDGPPVSGMLMFTKGDIATVMSKCSNKGWWYVNLKGLEGYVPGAYWEAYYSTSSPRASPPSRRKPPQPVPRNRSPPSSSLEKADRPEKPQKVEKATSMEDEPWYHGKMSRPQSEKVLSSSTNGVFLIRESVNRVGDLTLSVRWEGKSRHFPIEAKDGGLYYIGKHDFKTLHGVIAHYSKHALFYTEANEPVKLQSPAIKS